MDIYLQQASWRFPGWSHQPGTQFMPPHWAWRLPACASKGSPRSISQKVGKGPVKQSSEQFTGTLALLSEVAGLLHDPDKDNVLPLDFKNHGAQW